MLREEKRGRMRERGSEEVSCFFFCFFFHMDQMSSLGISTPLLCPLIRCTVCVCLWKCVLKVYMYAKICMDLVNTHSPLVLNLDTCQQFDRAFLFAIPILQSWAICQQD